MAACRTLARNSRRLMHSSGALPGADAPAIRVLTFHSVCPESWHPVCVSTRNFTSMLDVLKRYADPITPSMLLDILDGKAACPQRAALVTFDDGYTDNLTFAAPILEAAGVPALIFAAVEHIDRPDPSPCSTGAKYLSASGLRELAARPGITIGGHAWHHWRLAGVSEAERDLELRQSREHIEKLIGQSVDFFSYPFGDIGYFDMEAIEAVGQNYKAGFSNRAGAIFAGQPFCREALPRFHVDRADTPEVIRSIVTGELDGLGLIWQRLRHPGYRAADDPVEQRIRRMMESSRQSP